MTLTVTHKAWDETQTVTHDEIPTLTAIEVMEAINDARSRTRFLTDMVILLVGTPHHQFEVSLYSPPKGNIRYYDITDLHTEIEYRAEHRIDMSGKQPTQTWVLNITHQPRDKEQA